MVIKCWRCFKVLWSKKAWDAADYARRWRAIWTPEYKGYVDSATKGTLANLEKGMEAIRAGSNSTDLTPAARIAPLLLVCSDEKSLIAASRQQAEMTHNTPLVVDASQFIAQVTWSVIEGKTPVDAINQRLEGVENAELKRLITSGVESKDEADLEAVKRFGASCQITSTLPCAIHFIVKYQDSLPKAIEENIACGGESATRVGAIATVLGAYHGMDAVPEYVKRLKAYDSIATLLGLK